MAATKARRTIDDRSAAPHKPLAAAPTPRRERNCSVARTLDIVSDAWAFLIIREAFFGTRTFEGFRSALGIPRATLTDRLRKLTRLAIFRQVATAIPQPQRIPPHQDGVRSLSELHRADAVWRCAGCPEKSRRRSRSFTCLAAATVIPWSRVPTATRSSPRGRSSTATAPARAASRAKGRPQYAGALPMGAAFSPGGPARFPGRCRSSATNGASWWSARLFRKPALRQDSNGTRNRAQHPHRPAVAAGGSGRV